MKVSRTLLEVSLILLTVLIFVALVVLLIDPSLAALLTIGKYGVYPMLFLAIAAYASARAAGCTRNECIGYARAVCLLIGGLFSALGLFMTLASTGEHLANSVSVLLVGLGIVAVSYVVKRLTGVSCIPQLKSFSIFYKV